MPLLPCVNCRAVGSLGVSLVLLNGKCHSHDATQCPAQGWNIIHIELIIMWNMKLMAVS